MIHPILDIGMILLAFFLTTHLCFSSHTKDAYSLQVFLCYIFPYSLLLVGSDIYRTYWLRAGINRFFLLAKLLLFAFVVMFFASYTLYFQKIILQGLSVRDFLSGTLLFGSITFLLISSERFFIRYLESFGFRLFFLKSRMPQDMARVLIVGGGLHCRLYIQSLFCRDHMKNPFEIVGIVDDCLGLKHLNLYGFDVLGDSSNLDKLYRKYAFEKIIVTPECLKEEVMQNLERFQQDHPEVDILYFHISLNHQP